MSKILITGALGHIGSKLIHDPFISNHDVIAVDNMLTQRYCSLFNLKHNIKFIEKDFLDVDIPEDCIIIHLAAITNAAQSISNSKEVEKINVEQTKKFINKCIEKGVKKFIFPSSTSVYGVAADIVYEDDSSFENPQSPYAESKLEIEKYLKSKNKEIDYLILRFGTIFGTSPGMRFHTAVNKFCYQASINQPITVWSQNYTQVRPYLGIGDAIDCLKCVIEGFIPPQNTYNVLTGNYELKEVVGYIKEHIPSLEIEMVNTPLLNQFSYDVNDDKIKSNGFSIRNSNLEVDIYNTITKLKNLK